MAKNYIGLVQIKKYGGQGALWKEIKEMLKVGLLNLLCLRFWLYSGVCLCTPSFILCKISDLIMFGGRR